jgi:O-antigen/teichoic acid export membrane protein
MTDSPPSKLDYDLDVRSRFGLRGRMISNTGMLAGARLISALMGVATLIIAARVLSDNVAFGTLLFVHAYMLFFSEIASFQIWQTLIRFGADELKSKNANRLGSLIKTGLVIDFIAAILAFLLAISLFNFFIWVQSQIGDVPQPMGGGAFDTEQLKSYVVLYCTVILFRQINVAIGVFRLFDKFFVLSMRALVMPGIRLAGVLIAAVQGWGLTELLIIWFIASLASYLVLQCFAAFELGKRRLWPAIRQAEFCRSKAFPGLYSFIVKTNIDSTLTATKANFPSLAIMLIFGPALLAVYKIAEEISRLLSRAITLFNQVLFPELSRMAADLDLKTLARVTGRAAIGIGLVGFALSAIVLIFGVDLVKGAFDASFENAPLLAVMLLVASSLIGVATPFYTALYVLFKPGRAIWVRIIGLMSFIGLFFALSDRFGLFAIGWAAIFGAIIEILCVVILTSLILKQKGETLPAKD